MHRPPPEHGPKRAYAGTHTADTTEEGPLTTQHRGSRTDGRVGAQVVPDAPLVGVGESVAPGGPLVLSGGVAATSEVAVCWGVAVCSGVAVCWGLVVWSGVADDVGTGDGARLLAGLGGGDHSTTGGAAPTAGAPSGGTAVAAAPESMSVLTGDVGGGAAGGPATGAVVEGIGVAFAEGLVGWGP